MKKPNIIFVSLDQIRIDAIAHYYGNKNVQTPNLDNLAKSGVNFMLSYSANSVCAPARAAWQTGRFSCETGTIFNNEKLPKEFPDMGQWLSERGYNCYLAGKWHVVGRDPRTSYKFLVEDARAEIGDSPIARASVGFLKNYNEEKPFFLNIHLHNPHDVCYLALSKKVTPAKLGVEKNFKECLPNLSESYDDTKPIIKGCGPNLSSWTKDQLRLGSYYYFRMVEQIDLEIGFIFDSLKNSKFAKDTVLIFTADHGEVLLDHNMIHKCIFVNSSINVPMIVVDPNTPENLRGKMDWEHPINAIDATASILDYAQAPQIDGMHNAQSFKNLVQGKEEKWHQYAVSETYFPLGPKCDRSFITKDYKCVFNLETGQIQLYAMSDKEELNEISAQNPDIIAQFKKMHKEWEDSMSMHEEVKKLNLKKIQ